MEEKKKILVKNPKYDKKNPYSKKYIYQNIEDTEVGKSISESFNSIETVEFPYSIEEQENFLKYDVIPNIDTSYAELSRQRAKNQTWTEQLGNALVQFVGSELLIGFPKGFLDVADAAINMFNKDNDFINPITYQLEEYQNQIRNNFEIYRENPNASFDFRDSGYLFNGAVSLGTGIALGLSGAGWLKGISSVGKLSKLLGAKKSLGSIISGGLSKGIASGMKRFGSPLSATRINNAMQLGSKITTLAVTSRLAESNMEAREVYKTSYKNTLDKLNTINDEERKEFIANNPNFDKLTDEQIAAKIASENGRTTFNMDMPLLLLDLMQFKALGKLYKGFNPNITPSGKIRRANKQAIRNINNKGIDISTEDVTKTKLLKKGYDITKETMGYYLSNPIRLLKNIEISEGLEEMWQGYATEIGENAGKEYFDPTYDKRSLGEYLSDSSAWDQGFWGVLGGLVFKKGGDVLAKAKKYYNEKKNSSNTDPLMNAINKLQSEEDVMLEEIKSRDGRIKKLIDDLSAVNGNLEDAYDPYDYERDDRGNVVVEDGVAQYRKFDNESDRSANRESIIERFIEDMTMSAIDVGNYDLMKEYLTSKELKDALSEQGINLTPEDNCYERSILEKMEDVYNTYSDSLGVLVNNTNIENNHILRQTAKEMIHYNRLGERYINQAKKEEDVINDEINKIIESNSLGVSSTDVFVGINEDNQHILSKIAFLELNDLKRKYNSLEDDLAKGKITKDAYNIYKRKLNTDFKSIYSFISNKLDISELQEININNNNLLSNASVFETLTNILYDKYTSHKKYTADKQLLNKIESAGQLYLEGLKLQNEYNYDTNALVQQAEDNLYRYDQYTRDRFNNAAKTIEDWLTKQDNMQDSFNKLIQAYNQYDERNEIFNETKNKEVNKLFEALKILKLGYSGTNNLLYTINATIATEESRRAAEKEENKVVIEDGIPLSEKEAAVVQEELTSVITPPSTGEKTTLTEEEVSSLASVEETNVVKTLDDVIPDIENKEIQELKSTVVNRALTVIRECYERSGKNRLEMSVTDKEFHEAIDTLMNEFPEIDKDVKKEFITEAIKVTVFPLIKRLRKKQGLDVNETNNEELEEYINQLTSGIKIDAERESVIGIVNSNEINEVVDNFIKTYIKVKNINTTSTGKAIIDLDELMDFLNKEMDVDARTCVYILYNMRNYIQNSSKNYKFISKRNLNNIIKNPNNYINELINNRKKVSEESTRMHISTPTIKTDEYVEIVENLTPESELNISYSWNNKKDSRVKSSISITTKTPNGEFEIGYVATVESVNDNAGNPTYRIQKPRSGFLWELSRNGEEITSNVDGIFETFFSAILNKDGNIYTVYDKFLEKQIVGKNGRPRPYTDQEKLDILKIFFPNITGNTLNEMYQNIRSEMIDYVRGYDNEKNERRKNLIYLDTKGIERKNGDVSTSGAFQAINDVGANTSELVDRCLRSVFGVLEYTTFKNESQASVTYDNWKKTQFANWQQTRELQKALDKSNGNIPLKTTFGTVASSFDENVLTTETEKGIAEYDGYLPNKHHPLVAVKRVNGVNLWVDENGNSYGEDAGATPVGIMGLVVNNDNTNPYVATFSGDNKLSDTISKALTIELTDLFSKFQKGEITFNELYIALGHIYNGPEFKVPNIFKGFNVIKTQIKNRTDGDEMLALSPKGEKGKYTIVIHKNTKDGNVNNGIIYYKDGDINTKAGKIKKSYDKEFIDEIVKTLVDNTVFNRTLFSFNNTNTENTDNPYLQKTKDNKIIVRIGDFDRTYDSFYDFMYEQNTVTTKYAPKNNGNFFSINKNSRSISIDISDVKLDESYTANKTPQEIILGATELTDTRTLLTSLGYPNDHINFLLDNNLMPRGFIYKGRNYYGSYNEDTGIISLDKLIFKKGILDPTEVYRTLLHEQIHKHFNESGYRKKQKITDGLNETYKLFTQALQEDINKINAGEEVNDVSLILDMYKFNKKFSEAFIDEKDPQVIAEDWLTESLTRKELTKYLNSKEIVQEEEKATNKSIFQKIIDFLLSLFRIDYNDNSIFAKQYKLFADEIINNDNETISDESTIIPEDNSPVEGDEFADENSELIEVNLDEGEENNLSLSRIGNIEINNNIDNQLLDITVDGNSVAGTPRVTTFADMANYINRFPVNIQGDIKRLIESGNISFACRF